jgi:hypothetical protein
VYVHSRFSRAGLRLIVGQLLSVALFSSTVGTLFAAGTTGSINGTVADATGAPLADVTVTATSPTGQFKTTTNAKGFFAILGMSPDTFVVSFTKQGFEQQLLTGINVVQDGSTELNVKLSKALKNIAKVSARGQAGAYQPDQTEDQYTLGQDQITTVQGRDKNTSESNILGSLPGASFDSSGYPVLRGGRENEEGYQFEGIPIVDAFTNQFTNSLSVNGINSFQLTPGAGNASNGNSGTGSVNFTVKRGTYPAFGSIEGEAQSEVYDHQLSLEYGFANPSGTFSNYFSFIGQRDGNQIGPQGFPSVLAGDYVGAVNDFEENNLVDNLIFKFGQNKSYEFQALYQNQIDRFGFNYGGTKGTYAELGDPYFTNEFIGDETLYGALGFTIPDIAQAISPIPGIGNNYTQLQGQSAQYQPEALFKLQLSHSFNSSAYARLAFYGVDSASYFDYMAADLGSVTATQGSLRHGATFDLTDQLNSKNLLQAGLKYEYSHPIFAEDSADVAALGTGLSTAFGLGLGNQGFEFADFLPSNAPTAVASLPTCTALIQAEFGAAGSCGYLLKYFPNGVSAPNFVENSIVDESNYGAYITDDFQASKALKLEGGLRLDGDRTFYPTSYDYDTFSVPNKDSRPLILEPRLAATLQLSKNDTIRASYGRSEQVPPLADIADTVNQAYFNKFDNIPSYNVLTGMPATICGANHTSTCPNYGQQLFTEYQFLAGTPIQPVAPETFNSFDFSYEHEFPENIDVKVTPFYTRGYNIVDQVSNVVGVNPNTNAPIFGPALSTNLGIEKTSGIEFFLTKEAKYGFSGQLSATYINKLSNVPPLSGSEDFFPTIPTASLDLGNLYRVGYLSPFQSTLAVQYKSKGGLRINPQISYNKGYPLNPGSLTAVFVNGVAENVPNTNVTGPSNGLAPAQFVDPANPGTLAKPNVAATLGTPTTASAGGILSNARITANLTIELSPPGSHSTFGVQIYNLFDELYGRPSLNTDIQPVSTGVYGAQTGQLKNYQAQYETVVPYLAPTPASEFGGLPYNIYYANSPTSVLFYYQLKL